MSLQSVENLWLELIGRLRIPLDRDRPEVRAAPVILCYHGVTTQRSQSAATFAPQLDLQVLVEELERQLAWLKARRRVWPLDELIDAALSRHADARGAVAITFDDGYANNLTVAWPLLKRYSMPATIFLATGHIDGGGSPWWEAVPNLLALCNTQVRFAGNSFDLATSKGKHELYAVLGKRLTFASLEEVREIVAELHGLLGCKEVPSNNHMLTWRQVEAMDDPDLRFGMHGHSHVGLSRLSDATLEDDIHRCADALQAHVRHPSSCFAYPYGQPDDYDSRSTDVLKRYGCRSAVTTSPGSFERASRFKVPRVSVRRSDPIHRFQAKLCGWDRPFWWPRTLLANVRGRRRGRAIRE